NPQTIIFRPGKTILGAGKTMDFTNRESAVGKSALVEHLFAIEGVKGVFLGEDFLSITKAEKQDWIILKAEILGLLLEYFSTNRPILNADESNDTTKHAKEHFDQADHAIVEQIKELLETRIRPAVARDGGDITFHGFEAGVVYLTMRGACAGCPSSTYTLKMGIENMLRHYIPEVSEVRATA
ncbi:MAG: NifU family protein, partial [Pseudomonadota bacterium]